ncbi:MAG: phage terminase large subunit [Candidatus Neomarinimicrobiota bacterium]
MERNKTQDTKQTIAQIDLCADKVLCEHSFFEFVKISWDIVEPREFVNDWHIELICDHLQWCYERKIKRLIINIPPGCAKSLICSVFFPVWIWIKSPETKVLSGSHTIAFSIRDTIKSRNLINSDWFKFNWGHIFKMASDQNQKTVYLNDCFGERRLFSTGGGVTGARGDVIIYDDPINAMDAHSSTKIESCNLFFSETLSTRLNDPVKSIIIIIMQRLNQNDLTGFLLQMKQENSKQSGWTHLCLPMRFDSNRANKFDPRTKQGEILTNLHTEQSIVDLETNLGTYGSASQLQQTPSPIEGGYLKLEWFNYYSELPNAKYFTWSWDTAIKKGQHNDYSVGTFWAECDNGHYLVDLWRQKVEYPELKNQMQILFENQKSREVLIEDKASGQQLLQDLKRSGKIPIIAMVPGKNMGSSKEERVSLCSPMFESGKVFFPKNKSWCRIVIDELINFPNAMHDDILDTISQYLARRTANRGLRITNLS